MAITRSQIARQLLAEGGVSLDDAKAMAPEGEFLAYINPKEAQMLKDAGGSGIMTPMGIPSFVDFGSGSGTTITVTLVDSSSNIFSLFKSKSISANTTVELLTQPLVMEASEVLKVQAAYANRLHVVASILEIEPREVTT